MQKVRAGQHRHCLHTRLTGGLNLPVALHRGLALPVLNQTENLGDGRSPVFVVAGAHELHGDEAGHRQAVGFDGFGDDHPLAEAAVHVHEAADGRHAALGLDRSDVRHVVEQARNQFRPEPRGRVNPLEPPQRNGEQHHRQIRAVAERFGVGVDLVGAVGVEGGRVGEQHEVRACLLRGSDGVDVLFQGVEAGMMDEAEPAGGLVRGPLGKADVFFERGRGFGDEQRAPEAEFDLRAHVVTDGGFVQAAQIVGEGGGDGIGDPAHVFPRPVAGFVLSILGHGFAPSCVVSGVVRLTW